MSDKIIYQNNTKIIDEDGIIKESSSREIVIKDKSPMFMKIFTKDIGALSNVSSGASKLLFGLFRYVDRDNQIVLNKPRKQIISDLIGIKPTSIAMYLTELVKKGILMRPNMGVYMLNPYIFGKGSWEGVKELRATIVYNFDNLQKTVDFTQTSYITEEIE